MQRLILVLLASIFFFPLLSSELWAADLKEEIPEEALREVSEDSSTESREEIRSGGMERPREEAVRRMSETFLRSRLDDLERRILQIEGDLRFLGERTRNLDRRIDDLSRRH